jgi:3',5'-cyclic-AMP phosphodiesterase
MSGKIIKILQITDTHLFADSSGTLLGLNTEQSLRAVIASARKMHPSTSLVLATGDLTHDGSTQAYHRFLALMERFELPVYCLPGNHDEAVKLASIANTGHCITTDHARHGSWQFIFLDSTVPGSEGAHFGATTLQQLQQRLESAPDLHTLVCLHHQPVPMGSDWLDTMALDNAADFFAVIDRHPQVRGILWGHVHQAMHIQRNAVQLMSAPSTCIQFLPGSSQFAVDVTPPGYRWLELHPDGVIKTGIERIGEMPDSIDLAANGY